MPCEPAARSSLIEDTHRIRTAITCRENPANIMVEERTTHSINEKYPFRQDYWPTIHIGPNEVQFDSVLKIGLDDLGSFEANRTSVMVSVRQLTGRITYENYNVRPSEGDDDRRRTIATGDTVLPAQWV